MVCKMMLHSIAQFLVFFVVVTDAEARRGSFQPPARSLEVPPRHFTRPDLPGMPANLSVSSPASSPNDSAANIPASRPSDAEPWLLAPTREPTAGPTFEPSLSPDALPTATPTFEPSLSPDASPTATTTAFLTATPTATTLPAGPTTEQTGSSDATTTTTNTPDGSTLFPGSSAPDTSTADPTDLPGDASPIGNGSGGNTNPRGGFGPGGITAVSAGLLVLIGGVFFVRRRGNRSGDANDATAQPTDLEGGSSS